MMFPDDHGKHETARPAIRISMLKITKGDFDFACILALRNGCVVHPFRTHGTDFPHIFGFGRADPLAHHLAEPFV
jgi:hypothetical protein